MDKKTRTRCIGVPCRTCKWFGAASCIEASSCLNCENFGEETCHCLELVSTDETVCQYYKKKEVEE